MGEAIGVGAGFDDAATERESVDDRSGTTDACMPSSTTSNCDAKDTSPSQRTLSMSAGFDF